MTKPALPVAALTLLLALSTVPAWAQLGTENNPPPQRLFNTDRQPRLDTGLGTMAERRAAIASAKRKHRIVRR